MSNNNTMLTSLNDIPIKTSNYINSNELNDPDIKNTFKNFQKNIEENIDNDILNLHKQIPPNQINYNNKINMMDKLPEINHQQPEINHLQPELNYQLPEINHQEPEINYQQPEINFQQPETIYQNKKIYNSDFEKEMENLMDSTTTFSDVSNLSKTDNNTYENKTNLFTKQNIIKISIILIVFILVTNLNLIALLEKYIPEKIYNIIILYDKYIYYILSIVILYILHYLEYL